nr:hypothetical protein [Tanacetum cinerariifolium]
TPYYFPKVQEYVLAKPHHVIALGSSRNNSKESYGSNDMAHNYYLEEAKKMTQDKNRNLKPGEMPSARTHHTPNTCTPKPKSNNQTSRNWPASKSSEETLKAVQKADHSSNPSSFSDSRHFVCSTCQKCVFNANHDACITKFMEEVNSHVKIPTGNTFTSSTTKVDCEPPNGSNKDITSPYKCEQTLNVSAGTLNLSAGTPFNPKKERLRVWLLKKLMSKNQVAQEIHKQKQSLKSSQGAAVCTIVGITSDEEGGSESIYGIVMPKNGSLFMFVKEGELVDTIGSGATTSAIGAITSGAG